MSSAMHARADQRVTAALAIGSVIVTIWLLVTGALLWRGSVT